MKIQILIIYGPHSVIIVYGDAVILMQGRKPGTKCGGRPVQGLGTEVPQWGPGAKLKQFWISIILT